MEQTIFYTIVSLAGIAMLLSIYWKKMDVSGGIIGVLLPVFIAGWELKSQEFFSFLFYLAVTMGILLLYWWVLNRTKNEEKYPRENLILAMQIYNKQLLEDPEGFTDIDRTRKCAEDQVDYLIGIIKANHEEITRTTPLNK